MTIKNFTFFSPNGTEFPVGSNNDGKLYMMLTGMDYGTIRRKDWTSPLNTALNVQYTNTSIIAGGRYFELLNETVALKGNAVNYIHANIDLTQTAHPVTLSAETSDNSNNVDLNNNSGVLKVVIDIRTTNGTGVINAKSPTEHTSLDDVIINSLVNKKDIPWTDLNRAGGVGSTGTLQARIINGVIYVRGNSIPVPNVAPNFIVPVGTFPPAFGTNLPQFDTAGTFYSPGRLSLSLINMSPSGIAVGNPNNTSMNGKTISFALSAPLL
jgi:hypothetical protein